MKILESYPRKKASTLNVNEHYSQTMGGASHQIYLAVCPAGSLDLDLDYECGNKWRGPQLWLCFSSWVDWQWSHRWIWLNKNCTFWSFLPTQHSVEYMHKRAMSNSEVKDQPFKIHFDLRKVMNLRQQSQGSVNHNASDLYHNVLHSTDLMVVVIILTAPPHATVWNKNNKQPIKGLGIARWKKHWKNTRLIFCINFIFRIMLIIIYTDAANFLLQVELAEGSWWFTEIKGY